jgi:hypothetical protein
LGFVNRFWILDFGFWIGSALKGRSLLFLEGKKILPFESGCSIPIFSVNIQLLQLVKLGRVPRISSPKPQVPISWHNCENKMRASYPFNKILARFFLVDLRFQIIKSAIARSTIDNLPIADR